MSLAIDGDVSSGTPDTTRVAGAVGSACSRARSDPAVVDYLRVAIFKAMSEGERGFDAIAVVTDTDTLTPPCGACRQLIWEFCGDVPVILANLKGKTETLQMRDLFPKPFDSSNL